MEFRPMRDELQERIHSYRMQQVTLVLVPSVPDCKANSGIPDSIAIVL